MKRKRSDERMRVSDETRKATESYRENKGCLSRREDEGNSPSLRILAPQFDGLVGFRKTVVDGSEDLRGHRLQEKMRRGSASERTTKKEGRRKNDSRRPSDQADTSTRSCEAESSP